MSKDETDDDFEVYKGKPFSHLCREIHRNSQQTRNQIDVLITDLRSLIKGANDAMIIVPLIKDYLDVSVKNDDQLVKLAGIVSRISKKQQAAGNDGYQLTESEREQLLIAVEECGNKTIESDDTVAIDIDAIVNDAKNKVSTKK